MASKITKLNKITINNFRGLNGVEVEFGERLTLICGKNGTSKSTILGIVAQIFSFDTDYSVAPNKQLSFHTIHGSEFKSSFSDHFRFSKKHDVPREADIKIDLYDGYFQKSPESSLKLTLNKSSDRPYPRPVVRNNIVSETARNSSRNVTHPVVYLSLSRLLPISQRKEYSPESIQYLNDKAGRFNELTNFILNKENSSQVTATIGDISSAVSHGEHYDHESVSAGEDNVGQLVSALMSFEKLKGEYKDYHGGVLLIDEADAGLFPAAQVDFLKLASRLSKELDLQVIMTSHSPIMIGEIYNLFAKDSSRYKTIYLTDTFGPVRAKQDWGWSRIKADLLTETVDQDDTTKLPKINVYFEDGEAHDFFRKLVRSKKINSPLDLMKDVKIGSDEYKRLIQKKIKEFSTKSLIVFDADVKRVSGYKNCVKLPGAVPPDQLLFEYLLRMPSDADFWQNAYQFNKAVFRRKTQALRSRLNLQGDTISNSESFVELVNNADRTSQPPLRQLFKTFYQDEDVQKFVKGPQNYNPFNLWARDNPDEVERFKNSVVEAMKHIFITHYGLSADELSGLE